MFHTPAHKQTNPAALPAQLPKAAQVVVSAFYDESFVGLNLNAAYVSSRISRLGGAPTIMLLVSLDKRSEWPNGIVENSRYARLSIDANGVIENFSGSLPKFRKCKAKDADQAVSKINAWLGKAAA